MGLSSNNPLWLIEIPPTTTLSSCTTSGGVIGAVIAIRGATVDIGIANEGQMPARCRFDEPELSMAHICFVTSAEVGEEQGLIANQTFLSSISRAAGRGRKTLANSSSWFPFQNCFIKRAKPVFVGRGFADRYAVPPQ